MCVALQSRPIPGYNGSDKEPDKSTMQVIVQTSRRNIARKTSPIQNHPGVSHSILRSNKCPMSNVTECMKEIRSLIRHTQCRGDIKRFWENITHHRPYNVAKTDGCRSK